MSALQSGKGNSANDTKLLEIGQGVPRINCLGCREVKDLWAWAGGDTRFGICSGACQRAWNSLEIQARQAIEEEFAQMLDLRVVKFRSVA